MRNIIKSLNYNHFGVTLIVLGGLFIEPVSCIVGALCVYRGRNKNEEDV